MVEYITENQQNAKMWWAYWVLLEGHVYNNMCKENIFDTYTLNICV